jgi:o-succinylbenzoate synthase
MLKIQAILTERVLVPTKPEWIVTGGRGTHDQSPFLLLRLKCDGVEGLGEVSGTYGWSGEGYDTAEAAIKHVLAPALVGAEISPRTIRPAMDRVLAGFPFTKAGIEMACWDALGKALNAPVSRLLGGPVRDRVLTKFSISGREPDQAAAIARQAWELGFRKFKVKVGTGIARDLARVKAVREAIGEGVSLGVDANGGWSLGEARRILPSLEEFHISMIEQPLKERELHQMAQLRAHANVPILLDESVWNAADVALAAHLGAADAVNIYVGKAGGILPALEAVQFAKAYGMGATMGSNQELGIAHAAVMHVLASGDGFDLEALPPDAAAPLYYVEDITEPPFQLEKGEVKVPTGPGLGVTLNEKILKKYRIT